jgi:hypothetical protein
MTEPGPLAPPGIDTTLADPDVRGTLDFSQPIALMLLAVLHFIPDTADPVGIVRRLLAALPAGSYLIASHPTQDFDTSDWRPEAGQPRPDPHLVTCYGAVAHKPC